VGAAGTHNARPLDRLHHLIAPSQASVLSNTIGDRQAGCRLAALCRAAIRPALEWLRR
jgi:hypothetical protein